MRGRVASFIYFPATLQALYCFITTHFFKVWIEKKKEGGARMLRASNRTPYRAWGEGLENLACPRSCPGSSLSSPGPPLQGLSSPTHSLYLWESEFGSRRQNMVKIPWPWHYGWVCAKHRAEPDAKESKTANAWLSSHIHWPCPFWSHWKNSHQHTSVTSHGVCTWINIEHVFTGLTTLSAKFNIETSNFCKRN